MAFFSTLHGKNDCDGIGSTVKSFAARESLRRLTYNFILNAKDFYNVVREGITTIHFDFCTTKEHKDEEHILVNRIQQARLIKGTKNFHNFVPIENNKLYFKKISQLPNSESSLQSVTK